MARGIDVPNISTVVLYDVPTNVEAYIHRVGRTARAGRSGTAYTIVLPTEVSLTLFVSYLFDKFSRSGDSAVAICHRVKLPPTRLSFLVETH